MPNDDYVTFKSTIGDKTFPVRVQRKWALQYRDSAPNSKEFLEAEKHLDDAAYEEFRGRTESMKDKASRLEGKGLQDTSADLLLPLGAAQAARFGMGALAEYGGKAATSMATGTMGGLGAREVARRLHAPEWVQDAATVAGGLAGGLAPGKIRSSIAAIPDEVVGNSTPLRLLKYAATPKVNVSSNLAAENRAINPGRAVEPVVQAPSPEFESIPATQTPSGRRPGGISTIPPVTPVRARTPLWQNGSPVIDPVVQAPAPVEPIPATQTLSGRTPGGINNIPSAPPARPTPLWQQNKEPIITPSPEVNPIPATETPSGRRPGGINNITPSPVPPVTGAAPTAPAPSTSTVPPVTGEPTVPPFQPKMPQGMKEGEVDQFLAPMNRDQLNRQAHAMFQDMELPTSPAGQNAHPRISAAATNNFGKSWSKITDDQMRLIIKYGYLKRDLPVMGQLKPKP